MGENPFGDLVGDRAIGWRRGDWATDTPGIIGRDDVTGRQQRVGRDLGRDLDRSARNLVGPERAGLDLLGDYGVSTIAHHVVGDVDAAVAAAVDVGFPVAMKTAIFSEEAEDSLKGAISFRNLWSRRSMISFRTSTGMMEAP